MYLHMGKENMILKTKVLFVGHYDEKNEKKVNMNFFQKKREENKVRDISEGNPQSFVVTDDCIYLSLISASTLKKRLRANFI